MPFQPGNKLAKGGAQPGAGRPRKEQALEALITAEHAKKIIERHAEQLANKYVNRALSKQADRVLCHAIDKLVPSAKQQIELGNLDGKALEIKSIDGFNWDKYNALLQTLGHENANSKAMNGNGAEPDD